MRTVSDNLKVNEILYRRADLADIASAHLLANDHARAALGWAPRYDFRAVLERLADDQDYRSALAREVGAKGYHAQTYAEGPYPV